MKAITARTGIAHITPLMDAMWHQGILGIESCIFDRYEKFAADVISNNEVRVRSGVGMMQGRFFCNEPNTYDSAVINNGTQGENRIDLIVMRWTVDEANSTQDAETIVIQGTPAAGTAAAPSATEGDLDNGDLIADYPLYEVHLEGINITEVVPLFNTVPGIFLIVPDGVVDIPHGGTSGSTAEEARKNLGLGAAAVRDVVPTEEGGTGLNASPSMLINLASTAAANVMQKSPRPGVTGVLKAANGGTGASALTNLFAVTSHSYTIPSIEAGGADSHGTTNLTKSGYYPLGIVGGYFHSGSGSYAYITYLTAVWEHLTSKTIGSAAWEHRFHNTRASQAAYGTRTIEVLWIKVS